MEQLRVLERIQKGVWLHNRDVATVASWPTPALVDALLNRLASAGDITRHRRIVHCLTVLPTESEGWRYLQARPEVVVNCLERAWIGPDPFSVPALHDANLLLFNDYTQLILRLGEPCLLPARTLLLGPSRPVSVYRQAGADYAPFGAKITALALLKRAGMAQDKLLLARLAHRAEENPWVRLEALLVWPRSLEEAAHEAAGAGLHALPVLPVLEPSFLHRLARLGAPLVAELVHVLGAPDGERAAQVIELVGKPAVPVLLEFCRNSDEAAAWTQAEAILARIDPRAHTAARGSHADVGRGLSRAHSQADPATGLSRADGGGKACADAACR